MPHKQKHRGQHPNDKKLFGPKQLPALKTAVYDLSWLLTKNYNEKSALKLVGDRYRLNARQRLAVRRCAAAFPAIEDRKNSCIQPKMLKDKNVVIDGYNLLITIESALSGGYLFLGMDGCTRDIASIHGSYKKVEETIKAIELIGQTLWELQIKEAEWLLDAPVSNSGKLKMLLQEMAEKYDWPWSAALHQNPDKKIVQSDHVIISSDSWILDKAKHWLNFSRYIIEEKIPTANLIDLASGPSTPPA